MTPSFRYHISPDVFQKYPGYVRGVVLASCPANGPAPAGLTALLRAAEENLRSQVSGETIGGHPRIQSWREAFRLFGAKPSEFRSSIEAMARRALRGDPLPSINTLVDIGNLVSLQRLVPAGSHAIDHLQEDLWLRPALGTETFTAFGSDLEEHPLPGEIIFAEGGAVLCRRWVWRQAVRTLTLPETRRVEFNIDGLPPVSAAEVESICQEVIRLLRRFCGESVQARCEILSPENPAMSLSV